MGARIRINQNYKILGRVKQKKNSLPWKMMGELENGVGMVMSDDDDDELKAWRETRKWNNSSSLKCMAHKVFLLPKDEEEGLCRHSHTQTHLFTLLFFWCHRLFCWEEWGWMTHNIIAHSISHMNMPTILFISYFNYFLPNMVTKFKAGVDKCPRSKDEKFSDYMSLIF